MTALPGGMLDNVSILSLRCFLAVVETQSFSAAARQLRLSPSSATKHIQSIENAVGVALMHRTTRRVGMTEAGERFYEQCLTILAQIDSATAGIVAEQALTGHLRVAVPPSFAAAALGPHISRFLRDYPGMSVDVIVSSATPDPVRNRIDVAITLQTEPQSKLAHFLIAEAAMVLCAAPGYLARHGEPRTPGDLARHQCLSGRFSDRAEGWTLASGGGWQVVNVRSRLLSDNGELLRQACLGGAGIGNFYRFHVGDDLRQGRLVRLLPDHEPKPKRIFAVIPHRQIVRPQDKVFIEFVKGLIE
jgi:DNA-binding transcriptional LysR family regulator